MFLYYFVGGSMSKPKTKSKVRKFTGINSDHLLAIAPGQIYWKNLKGEFLGCNDLHAVNAGLKQKNDIVGLTDYDMPWKEYADFLREIDAQVVKSGMEIIIEEKSKTFDGQDAIWLSMKKPLRDEKGKIIGIICTSFDIAAVKEAERLSFENQAQTVAFKQQNKFKKIVDQVVHDIRSPIASMQMILPLCNRLPENLRVSLNKSAIRIADIANNLLNKVKPVEHWTEDEPIRVPTLISADLLEIVTEKKFEYSKSPLDFISEISQAGYFAFIHIDTKAFKRTLSNLINNAVDAVEGLIGKITTHLDVIDNKVQITIEDNGNGMPEDVKNKILNNISVTSGKTNGHGIGFSQIHDALHSNEGTLEINSQIGVGTKITVTFPLIENPGWIADKIELYNDALIVILDDDESIHGAWKARFKKSSSYLERKHFNDGNEVISFINGLSPIKKSKVFLLTDYELLEQNLHGLEVIQQTGIKNTILVTSHHNNQEVRDLAKLTNTKILPKPLASEIPIIISEAPVQINTAVASKIDMVYVEDDREFASIFKRVFATEDKVIDTYSTANAFLNNISKYATDTIILMDNQFEQEDMTGIELARQLHEQGFSRLYLFSGSDYTGDKSVPGYLIPLLKTDLEAVKRLL
jgi:signal transduction histidine kinase